MLRRNYIETSEVSGATEAQVALAESLIDAYVGRADRFYKAEATGQVTASLTGEVVDDRVDSPLFVTDNTYAYCYIHIIAGSGAGQQRFITASSRDGRSLTFEGDPFNPALDDTSVYRIYQLGLFPRYKDNRILSGSSVFHKFIPEAIREATIAQTEFVIEMGDDYFTGDDSEMDSERIMNYSYSRGGNAGQSALVKFVSPKARALLKGYKNSTGVIAVDHP
jgi:hypothetical protein